MKRKPTSNNGYKTVSVSAKHLMVVYTDTNKHFVYNLDEKNPNRETILFGKKIQQVKPEPKTDFLSPIQRQILDDILYSKNRYTREEISKMPLIRQYYITEIARKAERLLNRWKRDIVECKLDNFLLKLFPKSPVIKQLVGIGVGTKVPMSSDTSIDKLVSEKDIVDFLRDKGLFPKHI